MGVRSGWSAVLELQIPCWESIDGSHERAFTMSRLVLTGNRSKTPDINLT